MAFPSAADFQFADDADLDLSGLGISQISGDFADDLQNSFFFLGSFEEKGYICNSIKDYKYGKTDHKKYRTYKECGY